LFCLDLQLPDTLGMSGVQVLKAKFPDVPLAVVTSSSASEFESRCLEAGADAFIEKSNSPTQIIAALRSLLVSEEQAAIEDAATPAGPTKLSKRQKQLILMLDQGLSNRDIAEKLDISEHTVKVHFWRLFRRLGVNSRTQALHFARTNGWLGI
jgi:DNA-binding NarL/FixJ family response regulator